MGDLIVPSLDYSRVEVTARVGLFQGEALVHEVWLVRA